MRGGSHRLRALRSFLGRQRLERIRWCHYFCCGVPVALSKALLQNARVRNLGRWSRGCSYGGTIRTVRRVRAILRSGAGNGPGEWRQLPSLGVSPPETSPLAGPGSRFAVSVLSRLAIKILEFLQLWWLAAQRSGHPRPNEAGRRLSFGASSRLANVRLLETFPASAKSIRGRRRPQTAGSQRKDSNSPCRRSLRLSAASPSLVRHFASLLGRCVGAALRQHLHFPGQTEMPLSMPEIGVVVKRNLPAVLRSAGNRFTRKMFRLAGFVELSWRVGLLRLNGWSPSESVSRFAIRWWKAGLSHWRSGERNAGRRWPGNSSSRANGRGSKFSRGVAASKPVPLRVLWAFRLSQCGASRHCGGDHSFRERLQETSATPWWAGFATFRPRVLSRMRGRRAKSAASNGSVATAAEVAVAIR